MAKINHIPYIHYSHPYLVITVAHSDPYQPNVSVWLIDGDGLIKAVEKCRSALRAAYSYDSVISNELRIALDKEQEKLKPKEEPKIGFNLLTSDFNDLQSRFNAMEGTSWFGKSIRNMHDAYTLYAALCWIARRGTEIDNWMETEVHASYKSKPELKAELLKATGSYTVKGNNDWHKYYINAFGDIVLDKNSLANNDIAEVAAKLSIPLF